jgi:hypothetical protein
VAGFGAAFVMSAEFARVARDSGPTSGARARCARRPTPSLSPAPRPAPQEVKDWLEQIMRSSQARANYHMDIVTDEIPSDRASLCLPTFVGYQ